MSSASPTRDGPASTQRVSVDALQSMLQSAVRSAGFWAAVLLPFVILAMLATGVVQRNPILAASLFALNVVGLVAGKNYNR